MAMDLGSLDDLGSADENRIRIEEKTERLLAIGRECAKHIQKAENFEDYTAFLYDEHGLPK